MALFHLDQHARQLGELNGLNLSADLMAQAGAARIVSGAKDLLTGTQPVPSSFGEGVKFFTDTIFGKPRDPFYYRSKYGIGIYNYFIIKGESPSAPELSGTFTNRATELSSYRTKYVNPDGNNPNTWDKIASAGSNVALKESFPAIFVDSAIINVNKKKDVVMTKVVNNSSTRKEYISDNDYDINISGVFTSGEANIYPAADVEALVRALEAPIPLEILCPHLYRFGITRMVVTGFSLPQEKGVYSTQRFSITAKSHAPVYSEIGAALANDSQDKNATQTVLDKLANLRTQVDSQIQDFFANR